MTHQLDDKKKALLAVVEEQIDQLLAAGPPPAEVEALRQRIATLEAALLPFALASEKLGAKEGSPNLFVVFGDRGSAGIKATEFWAAREVLRPGGAGEGGAA